MSGPPGADARNTVSCSVPICELVGHRPDSSSSSVQRGTASGLGSMPAGTSTRRSSTLPPEGLPSGSLLKVKSVTPMNGCPPAWEKIPSSVSTSLASA